MARMYKQLLKEHESLISETTKLKESAIIPQVWYVMLTQEVNVADL